MITAWLKLLNEALGVIRTVVGSQAILASRESDVKSVGEFEVATFQGEGVLFPLCFRKISFPLLVACFALPSTSPCSEEAAGGGLCLILLWSSELLVDNPNKDGCHSCPPSNLTSQS